MDIPEDKNNLIALKLGKIREELDVLTHKNAEKTRSDWAKRGFTIYDPTSEFYEIWIPYLKSLALKYMDIYLEVLAPNKTRISDNLLNFIHRRVLEALQGLVTGINQELTGIAGGLSFSNELYSALSEIRNIIERELKIKQGDRNSVAPEKEVPKSSSAFAKNKEIFLAHIFAEENLIVRLKEIITKNGYSWKEGKREDLGSISEDILSKI